MPQEDFNNFESNNEQSTESQSSGSALGELSMNDISSLNQRESSSSMPTDFPDGSDLLGQLDDDLPSSGDETEGDANESGDGANEAEDGSSGSEDASGESGDTSTNNPHQATPDRSREATQGKDGSTQRVGTPADLDDSPSSPEESPRNSTHSPTHDPTRDAAQPHSGNERDGSTQSNTRNSATNEMSNSMNSLNNDSRQMEQQSNFSPGSTPARDTGTQGVNDSTAAGGQSNSIQIQKQQSQMSNA
ncbi:MAG: hypothetical protein K2Z81_20065, partial [Cyanobacteria bacterium]|nr:hypothetical protein [Cyanobacteriota bacterium]